jgi:hypothetical protein
MTGIAAIIYAAKSTSDPRGSNPSQLAAEREAIEREGGRTVIGPFSDENASAYSGSRGPGLAAAIEAAKQASPSELWCFDPDRLARGDGSRARHLGGLYFELLEAGVRLRAVNGDSDLADPIRAVLRGERAHQDSDSKGGHVKRGLGEVVDRREWRGGSLPDGYDTAHTLGSDGKISRRYVKSPERGPILQLVWDLALEDRSLQAIQLELSNRGYRTAPRRKFRQGDLEVAKPQVIAALRIAQILSNPIYAGLQTFHGETHELADWPTFVSIEDFHRLQAARRTRSHSTKRRVGRPPEGYLLHELARCGHCGGAVRVETQRRPRKDGTRRRTYVCQAHLGHHRDSAEWCAAEPFDAELVDRRVVEGVEDFVADRDSLRERVLVRHREDRQRLAKIAERAQEEMAAARRAAERARHLLGNALSAGDSAEVLLKVADEQERDAQRAEGTVNAALDALAAPSEEPAIDEQEKLWRELSERVGAAGDDMKALGAVLRELFHAFVLHHERAGVAIAPIATFAEAEREPERLNVTVLHLGRPATVRGIGSIAPDGTPELVAPHALGEWTAEPAAPKRSAERARQ